MKIKPFQLYCLLVVCSAPVAYLEISRYMNSLLAHNGWLAVLAAILPCFIFMLLLIQITRKSPQPFPLLLEDYLGTWLGRVVGCSYILVFIMITAIDLRFFVDFIETHVVSGTPLSVLVGVLLLVGLFALKSGFNALIRSFELVVLIGLPFVFIILILALPQDMHISNLLPIGSMMRIDHFMLAVLLMTAIFARSMPVLTFAYFSDDPGKIGSTFTASLASYWLLMLLATLITTLTLGAFSAELYAFPTFIMVTMINIGRFFQNIDILFISIWILGIYASISVFWFMSLYTCQQVFRLSDYRYLAAPSSLIIGVLAMQIADNILQLFQTRLFFVMVVYGGFFILIPSILFIISLFKPSMPEAILSAKAE